MLKLIVTLLITGVTTTNVSGSLNDLVASMTSAISPGGTSISGNGTPAIGQGGVAISGPGLNSFSNGAGIARSSGLAALPSAGLSYSAAPSNFASNQIVNSGSTFSPVSSSYSAAPAAKSAAYYSSENNNGALSFDGSSNDKPFLTSSAPFSGSSGSLYRNPSQGGVAVASPGSTAFAGPGLLAVNNGPTVGAGISTSGLGLLSGNFKASPSFGSVSSGISPVTYAAYNNIGDLSLQPSTASSLRQRNSGQGLKTGSSSKTYTGLRKNLFGGSSSSSSVNSLFPSKTYQVRSPTIKSSSSLTSSGATTNKLKTDTVKVSETVDPFNPASFTKKIQLPGGLTIVQKVPGSA